MMQQPIPLTRDLVLIGGGHTHALVLRRWGMDPLPGARLTLINPDPKATYSGMLPGFVAGHYSRADLDIDLVRLARFAGARLILGKARALDWKERTIDVTGHGMLRFDIASIDVGVTSALPSLPGFAKYAVPAKPLGAFAEKWDTYVASAAAAGRADVVVVGAGVAGVELTLAMAHRLHALAVPATKLTLIDATDALSNLADRARNLLLEKLKSADVTLQEQTTIASIEPDAVLLDDGRRIASSFCVGVAGAQPLPWLAETGLHLTDGFITVNEDLRVSGGEDIYAVGDCAHMAFSPRPKAGVFAVRQAPVLHHNLRADLTGRSRRRYKPQSDYLKLISLGEKSALADKAGRVTAASWLWRFKNRIDTKFMDKFRDLPVMPTPALPRDVAAGVRTEFELAKPLCGGCGAKVGPGDLDAVLSDLGAHARDDVLSEPGDDAAILSIGGTKQVLTTDHLRAVVEDPALMAKIATIHALGDVWAMGAAPQAGLANVVLPRMSPPLQRATLAEITNAIRSVLADAGADLVGGHTTLGAELTIGVTATGLCDGQPLTLAGAEPGDVLLLTKPLGSGTLLAAEMALEADGAWIAELWDMMVRSSGPAAALLSPYARAMTDVTGFGLAGHLLGIADASGVECTLDPSALQFYSGARELTAQGIRSSLFPSNAAYALPRMSGFKESSETDLLLDPQTCGGLLASVPASYADDLLRQLAQTPTPAAIIGHVIDGLPRISCL